MFGVSSATIAALLMAAAISGSAGAAQYKWIGADGSVNYGDRPPTTDAQVLRGPGVKPDLTPGDSTLPYALRAATAKYPVVIYSTSDCKPCQLGRGHLVQRGVPFSERLIRNAADSEAMKKLGFEDGMLPAMTVGRQKMNGFEAGAWNNLLDAAGYPKSSMLPRGYPQAAAEPLTAAVSARSESRSADAPPSQNSRRGSRNSADEQGTGAFPATPGTPPGFRF